jgi:hypothetical protein
VILTAAPPQSAPEAVEPPPVDLSAPPPAGDLAQPATETPAR